jgi:hypothetical protein
MRRWLLFLLCILFWTTQAGAQFVAPGGAIPVVANLPGLAGTFWRSDVSILNVGDTSTSVTLQLYPEIVGGNPVFEPVSSGPISVPAHSQITLANVVQSRFGLTNAKGGLFIYSDDGAPLVLSSRTYTHDGEGGSYGQDVSSVQVASAAWAAGLEHDSLYRTNVGIFWLWPDAADFTVTIYSANGDVVGSGVISFSEAGLQQRSLSDFGVEFLVDGFLEIACSDLSASWYAYASRVDQRTGDAVFRIARGRMIEAR